MFLEQQNQYIRMISEESCDTEDWSNDAENPVLHNRNQLYFKIYQNKKVILNWGNILQYCCFLLYFFIK